MAEGLDKVVQFDLRGEKPFYLRLQDGRVVFSRGRHEHPGVTLLGSSRSFYEIMVGRLDQEEAYNLKKYQVVGSIRDAIRFKILADSVQESYLLPLSILRSIARWLP